MNNIITIGFHLEYKVIRQSKRKEKNIYSNMKQVNIYMKVLQYETLIYTFKYIQMSTSM